MSRSKHPLYDTWCAMRSRCGSPKSGDFANYGGRGITVSPDWLDFDVFVRDMGPKPGPEYSIDRIDNSAGYCRENCRWATRSEQGRNKRPRQTPKREPVGPSKASAILAKMVMPEVSMAELANKIGVSRQQVWAWLHKKSQPSMKHMIALRDELGIELEWWVKP